MQPVTPNHPVTRQPKLLNQACDRKVIRTKHYRLKTEEAYVQWIKRFILFHHKRHPREMGEKDVRFFLNHLAIRENVVAATQNSPREIYSIRFNFSLPIKLQY